MQLCDALLVLVRKGIIEGLYLILVLLHVLKQPLQDVAAL